MKHRIPRALGLALVLKLLLPGIVGAQAPWTVVVTPSMNPLPVGMCGAVGVTVTDPATGEVPRGPDGYRITISDFDMTVAAAGGPTVVGRSIDVSHWVVCACQGAAVGSAATITATYPAKALSIRSRVSGVDFQATAPFTLARAKGTLNPSGCPTTLLTAVAVAPVTTVAPASAPVPPPIAPIASGTTSGATGSSPPIASGVARIVAVSGITIAGSTASADVSWQPVPGAVSYSIKRTTPDGNPPKTYPGITTTTWKDLGPLGIGFPLKGVYLYEVTAAFGGSPSVSGQASWTRPDPTCAAPPPGQPLLSILDPWGSPPQLTWDGPLPSGASFGWQMAKNNSFVAFRMERSVQGSNAWTLAATSCGGGSPIIIGTNKYSIPGAGFFDGLGGVIPGTTYLYRVTALAATGEAGGNTVSWTAPNAVFLRWLSATITGSTVTLRARYEQPATNPPVSAHSLRVTTPYGDSQLPSGNCAGLAGCSFVFSSVPSGAQRFTILAEWGRAAATTNTLLQVLATVSADTTVVVP